MATVFEELSDKFYTAFYEPDVKAKYCSESFGVDDEVVTILHLAKFIPRKQQLFMVDVMRHLPDNYMLVLAGPLTESGPLYGRDRAYYDSIVEKVCKNCW